MKLPSLVATVVFSTLVPTFAITDAEITPAALAGKSLTFTIETAGGGFADTGTWTGTFGNPTFTVTKLTGNTVNITTTHTTTLNGFTIVTLPEFVAGSGTTTITLDTQSGVGRYEVNLSPVGPGYQIGTFTIGAAAVKAPEINVLNDGDKLTDGSAKVGFGTVKTDKSVVEKFTIKNTGKGKLTGLAITKNGANKADFTVGALPKTSLAAGASMTVNVTFKPTSKGKKAAAIHFKSNDADESPFDIKLAGTGTK